MVVTRRLHKNEHSNEEEWNLPRKRAKNGADFAHVVSVEDEVFDECKHEHEDGDVPEFDE